MRQPEPCVAFFQPCWIRVVSSAEPTFCQCIMSGRRAFVHQRGGVRRVPGLLLRPNQKGMALLGPGDRSDFLRRQVLTSRNVRGGRLTDFALGALNYQIEHHLFPSMPRPNLRHAQHLVAAFCHPALHANQPDQLVPAGPALPARDRSDPTDPPST